MSTNPVFVGSLANLAARIQNASGTSNVALLAGAANGSRIRSLLASSDDTSSRTFQLVITKSGVDYPLGQITVPAGAGTGTAVPVNVLDRATLPWLQSDGVNNFVDVANGSTLQARAIVSVAAGKTVAFFGEYGDI